MKRRPAFFMLHERAVTPPTACCEVSIAAQVRVGAVTAAEADAAAMAESAPSFQSRCRLKAQRLWPRRRLGCTSFFFR